MLEEDFKPTQVMDLKFPAKALIAIIQRGAKVIIPKGNTVLEPKDLLIIFTKEENSLKIKEFFKK